MYRAHLQTELTLGGATLAPAGTPVEVLVIDVPVDGTAGRVRIALRRFTIKAAATELPVVPLAPLVDALAAGAVIAARTTGTVIREADRTIVRVPLPFALSSDAPNAAFTPLPYRTTAPVQPPLPSARPSPTGS